MAWTLLGFDFDLMTLVLPLAKAVGGGLCGLLVKRVWRYVMTGSDVDPTKCRIKGCKNFKQSMCKGLCTVCYKNAKSKVERGVTTWERLADLGLCDAPDKGSAFDEAFNKATKDNGE